MIAVPPAPFRTSTLPPAVQEILDDLDLVVTDCVRVAREREDLVEHYRIEAAEGAFFLKVRRPENSVLKSAFHRVFGRPSMQRQIDVLTSLQRVDHGHLRIPRLVHADAERFLLMDYIPPAEHDRHAPDPDALVSALLAFQRTSVARLEPSVGLVLLDVVLHPEARTAHAVLRRLRARLGSGAAAHCLRVLWRCRQSQPRLDRPMLVHNDFHPENVLIGIDGEIYLSDFENVTSTRRWLLLDIVHYAVATHEMEIDTSLIRRYIAALRHDTAFGSDVCFEAQVRIALLRRIVQHVTTSAPPEHVRASYARFLTDSLLPDRAFEDWYADRLT